MSVVLILAFILFAGGLILCLTKRNIILILIGIELILNASNLNIIHFSHLQNRSAEGQTLVLFIMVIAGAQAALALAIILKVYRQYGTILLDQLRTLKR
jgi:NADH-quinone oxidoreductase subunit K